MNNSQAFCCLAVYSRLLDDQEIKDMAERERLPQNGLAAFWEFRGEPDREGNYVDQVKGMMMHLKMVRVWE
jgi:hypothetical protein